MKKFFIMSFMLMLSVCFAMAQGNQASIKFDKVVHNFGTFSEDAPTQKCVFTYCLQMFVTYLYTSCA